MDFLPRPTTPGRPTPWTQVQQTCMRVVPVLPKPQRLASVILDVSLSQ